MRTSGTYRVEAVMRHLPEHDLIPVPITIPATWVRQQDSAATAGAIDRDDGAIRPSGLADPLLARLMDSRVTRKAARELLIPDALAPWASSTAGKVAGRLPDVAAVYATSPPYSAMILADDLGRKLGVPVIQELRDPPSFNRWIKHRSAVTKRRMERFEKRHLTTADAVITVTPGTRRRLLELHPELDPGAVHVVTNGYPDVTADPSRSSRDPLAFTLTFTGTFLSGAKGREDGPFNPAILIPHLAGLDGPSDLRIAGTLLSGQSERLAGTGPAKVTLLGHLAREDAIAETAAGDVAVVVADDDDWWIGRKVFEYLAFASRILAVVPEGDTANLLRQSPRAVVVPIGDSTALAEALHSLHADWRSGSVPSGSEPFVQSDESCVAEIAGVIRSVVG
jgi:hypothetical protein